MHMPDPHTSPEPKRAPRWVGLVTSVAMFGAGVGIGWLATTDPPPASETTTTPTTMEIVAPPTTFAPPVADEPMIDGPTTDEPIADVAEALLASMVQIELPLGGLGSGVIYAPDGKIMTAAHVVEGVEDVTVRLFTGERVPGVVLGADSNNDIAVISIDRTGLPAAPLALDDRPRVGQMAIAIGSPWGLDSTVTAGVVSAVDRSITDERGPRTMIQTDAPINPGNSGGALADRHGRVIGINVSIFSSSGANDGVGFAVPIDRALAVAQAVVGGGEFVPGFLGVGLTAPDGGQAGTVINELRPDSAAISAGLQLGDVIIGVDGLPVREGIDLAAQIRSRQAGEVVVLTIIRDGVEMEISVTLGAR